MTTVVPSQPQQALIRANHIRLNRAAIRRDIFDLPSREGREAICELILHPGELWATAKLNYVLSSPVRSGPRFVTRMLYSGRTPLSPLKTLGSMTDRQRVELVSAIRTYGKAGL